jgi:quercetin dioxygenase-like cupin family protein
MMVIPADSAGKSDMDLAGVLGTGAVSGYESNPAMHSTQAIDYVLVLSGRVDSVLPGARRRTLVAGDFVVITGVAHAWENRYSEDCACLVVTVGATQRIDGSLPTAE